MPVISVCCTPAQVLSTPWFIIRRWMKRFLCACESVAMSHATGTSSRRPKWRNWHQNVSRVENANLSSAYVEVDGTGECHITHSLFTALSVDKTTVLQQECEQVAYNSLVLWCMESTRLLIETNNTVHKFKSYLDSRPILDSNMTIKTRIMYCISILLDSFALAVFRFSTTYNTTPSIQVGTDSLVLPSTQDSAWQLGHQRKWWLPAHVMMVGPTTGIRTRSCSNNIRGPNWYFVIPSQDEEGHKSLARPSYASYGSL